MKRKTIFACIVSLLLVLCLLSGCGQSVPADDTSDKVTEKSEADKNEPILRFAAMSDSHIGDANTEESMRRTLKYLNEYGGELDVFMFSGDLTDTTGSTASADQIGIFKSVFEKEVGYESAFIYSLGPTHDVPSSGATKPYRELYRDTFGEQYFKNDVGSKDMALDGARHIVVNGYHFFSIDHEGDENGFSSDALKWLEGEIASAVKDDPEKPFFVSTHVPGMPHVAALLAKYPQAVCFTGHVHNSAAREDSITQDGGYTNVHCGGMNYYRVDGYNRFFENPFLELGEIRDFAQAIYVEVYEDNSVRITRLDGYNGAEIAQPWEIAPGNYNSYTNERLRGALSTFNPDCDMKVLEIENGLLQVSFDAADPRNAGVILYYAIEVYENIDGEYTMTQHAEIASQEVFYPNGGFPDLFYDHTFNGVDLSDYAVAVTACDCWGFSSNSLMYTNGSYDHSKKVTGNISVEQRELTDEEKLTGLVTDGELDIEFTYGSGDGPSQFTEDYTMAVRFHPSVDFSDVEFRCSSWGDEIGTLDFKLYSWQGDYDSTIGSEPIDSYSLTGFKGSTVYKVFDEMYTSGEYLVEITCPNPDEGVGVYYYQMDDERDDAYLSYENGSEMEQHIYFSWTNSKTCSNPYVPIN
ncbi:MAG: metallophosphoesterase [Clostridia bacterium]|nr:metallophosphoesterase [Clostridia bacterium]